MNTPTTKTTNNNNNTNTNNDRRQLKTKEEVEVEQKRGIKAMTISEQSARETLDIVHEISKILNCEIDRESLAVSIQLIENGASPEAVAMVVKELKREGKRLEESRRNENRS
jgi:mitotic-spindle organizing protein 1